MVAQVEKTPPDDFVQGKYKPSKIVCTSIPANIDKRLEVIGDLRDSLVVEAAVSYGLSRRDGGSMGGDDLTVLMTEMSNTVRKHARETETTTTVSLKPLM